MADDHHDAKDEAAPAARRLFVARVIGLAAMGVVGLALLRLVVFTAHQPLYGYGNNWDQVRYTACVGLFPHAPEVVPPGSASPDRPPVVASLLPGVRGPCVWTSEITFDAAAWLLVDDSADDSAMPPTVSVRAVGWLRVAVLALDLIAAVWLLRRRRPMLALGFSVASLAVLPDPAIALWVNTFYAEFTAVTALVLSAGWLLAARRHAGTGVQILGFVAALVLAMAKVQFAPLPLALWLGAMAATSLTRRRMVWPGVAFLAGAVAGLAMQIVQLQRDDADIRLWHHVTTANVVFNGVLGASDDPARTAAALGLPPKCAALAGTNWFTTPRPYEEACPEAYALGRGAVAAKLLRHEPMTLLRVGSNALAYLDPWVQRELGHVAGESYGDVIASGRAWSFSDTLERHTPLALLLVLVPGFFVAAGLLHAPLRCGRWREAWTGAWLACAVIWSQLVFTAFGDGVHDLSRQAFLVYAAALFWAIALIVGQGMAVYGSWWARRTIVPGTTATD